MKDLTWSLTVKPITSVLLGFLVTRLLMDHMIIGLFGDVIKKNPDAFLTMDFVLYLSFSIAFLYFSIGSFKRGWNLLLIPAHVVFLSSCLSITEDLTDADVSVVVYLSIVLTIISVFGRKFFERGLSLAQYNAAPVTIKKETAPAFHYITNYRNRLLGTPYELLQENYIIVEEKLNFAKKAYKDDVFITHNLEKIDEQLYRSMNSLLQIRKEHQAEAFLFFEDLLISMDNELEGYLEKNDVRHLQNLEKIILARKSNLQL